MQKPPSARAHEGVVATNLFAIEEAIERRDAEKDLRPSEASYRQIFESAQEGIWIQDADTGEILDVNPFLVELLGFSRTELLGRRPWELPIYESPEEGERRFEELKREGSAFFPGIWKKTRDGRTLEIESIANVYSVGSRRMVQWIMRDVSERAQLEEELRQAQKMESIGRLAGGLAHDFNNILNIIAAYTGLLERDIDPRKKTETLDGIHKAVQRGAAVARQLLTFARKEGASFRSTDVNDVVKECASMASETFPRRITVSVELNDDIPKIHADPNQIHQALLNLCVNARDAITGSGRLTLATAVVGGAKIRSRFPGASDERYVCVSVSDTGSGMDEETRSRIFEPFFTTKGAGGGSGLGLPVVYGIVKAHSGFVDIKSAPGKGTAFSLYLPVEKSDQEPRGRRRDTPARPAGRAGGIFPVQEEPTVRPDFSEDAPSPPG